MEKYLIIIILFFFNPLFGQKIIVLDNQNDPIYNVGFFKKDQTKAKFSNFKGEVDLSEFKDNDTIIVQHPTFKNINILKSSIKLNKIILETKIINIDEVVFSVNKWEENRKEITNKTLTLSEKKIKEVAPQTSADLLEKSGEIFIQKSQLGGGSPMIRGFSANKILISLDGVRLNNIIYRSGNIHNIIGIDPNILGGIEVLFGPASVMYGSDALGGAINFKVKDPVFNASQIKFNSSQKFQYNSSSNSKHYSLNFGVSSKKIATLTSLSLNSFEDLKSGKKRKKEFKEFGYRDEYVIREFNEDKIILNENKHIQKFSGYNQLDFINKINFKVNNNINIIHGFYLSKSSNIPRYDRLTYYNDNFIPKYSEWYYGPNYFLMNKIELNNFSKTKYYDAFRLNISHQNVKESRHDRRFEDNHLNNRYENVNVSTINFDFDKKSENSETFYGFESIYNKVNSEGDRINILNNLKENISTRYPDKGTKFYSNSIYISNKRKVGQLFSNIGLRASTNKLLSNLSNKFYDFPFDQIELNNSSISGNIGFRYNYRSSSFKFQFSNGFRSPNLDDVGKIFDSEPGNIIVPNANLKPEYVNNFEINYELNHSKLNIKNSIFYIKLDNAIIRGDGSLNGNDSIIYDGVLSKVQQLNNGGKAYIFGFSNSIRLKVSETLLIENSISYSDSKDLLNDRPLRHTPPLFGKFSVTYSKNKNKIGYFISYNGKKELKNFSVSELNKLYLYTESGSPSWVTHNFFYKLNYNYIIDFDFGIDNIFDIHYRTYSSGISAPGRNIRLGINLKF